MKRSVLLLGLLALAAACAQQTASTTATLNGTYDLVMVDERPDGELSARAGTGVPNRYLFITSSDTNELRVLRLWREDLLRPAVLRGPNPLGALSVPVLDRPTLLVTDEGQRADTGERVTGSYVFASRPGAAEISFVTARPNAPGQLRQVSGRPFATPAPVTALAATLGSGLTALPAKSTLYFATWDGARGSLYALELPTDSAALRDSLSGLSPRLVLELGPEIVVAVQPVAQQASRSALGAPFCATGDCLAIATRPASPGPGRAVLFDPASRRMVPLAFPAPVRKFTVSTMASRLYALLDEEACGGPACGGVVTVDLTSTDATGAFPLSIDFSGLPMSPIRVNGALATGLTVAENAAVRTTAQVPDGGTGLEFQYQTFTQLGAVAGSNGELTFFDALAGSVIDFDARPAEISDASVRLPLDLGDGGVAFAAADGGAVGSLLSATVTRVGGGLGDAFRVYEVTDPDRGGAQQPLVVDVSDGYFDTQALYLVSRGLLPGLVALPTVAADGLRLPLPEGVSGRVLVGDVVRFESGDAAAGFLECGRATVTAVAADAVEIDQVPSPCAARVRFSVSAAGSKPLVAYGELDGYFGRGASGETITFERRYATLPAGYTGPRVALRLTLGDTLPPLEGAYLLLRLSSRAEPYRLSVDTQTVVNCSSQLPSQFVLGNLVMAQVPTAVTGQTGAVYNWSLWGAVPSANGVLELDQRLMRTGLVGSGEAVFCHR